ncbi:amylo-alpha-1,6-glucosidase [Cellvibrio mixtus]|uniref:amylo-alpha-1,6-glucosidase n=1 Tax=Cellvibrio mixtus TaxID=39650 RepID=UPI0005871DEB|nr:amylo-alpha-1,6-glucosidase [Cellvibrio mixtus]
MKNALSRLISFDVSGNNDSILRREWLQANGLGGFSSGTLAGGVTRRYHGLLVAALPAPLGRTVMLSRVQESIKPGNDNIILLNTQDLGDNQTDGTMCQCIESFHLDTGLPVWTYQTDNFKLEKRILMLRNKNTVLVNYHLVKATGTVEIDLRPAVHFRPLEASVNNTTVEDSEYSVVAKDNIYQIHGGHFPPLLLKIIDSESTFNIDNRRNDNIYFRLEYERGYAAVGKHWSPGFFKTILCAGQSTTIIASTETADDLPVNFADAYTHEIDRRKKLLALAPIAKKGNEQLIAELILAADQFIITPGGRVEETERARAAGEEVKTIIAGYHWFTDWGRDTMISLEGLTLTTGRHTEARYILRTFANYVRDGLIPNMFPEHDKTGLYHTADASLWFFHALNRYVKTTQDRATLRVILPKLISIVEHHLAGTRFNIAVDPNDGLLQQGEEGYQLTWMDAKVNDWVVTPRRGKAVELNALWFNALRLLENWLIEERDDRAYTIGQHAQRAQHSFNERFWNPINGYLYDVIDGPEKLDDSCRPNQIFSIALDHPVLDPQHWKAVVEQVKKHLLTPVGLRSLSPQHRDYKPNYDGDLFTRDAAYHQGTVWAWLIGPYIDAWVKTYPEERVNVSKLLSGFEMHMNDAGVGSISEIFDAEPPFTPRGCIAQAWSVAEVLRCLATYS